MRIVIGDFVTFGRFPLTLKVAECHVKSAVGFRCPGSVDRIPPHDIGGREGEVHRARRMPPVIVTSLPSDRAH